MSETRKAASSGVPTHLWVVGFISLLWNAMGCLDYVLTELHIEAYTMQFTAEQQDFFHDFPGWVVAAWAVAVWGGLLGSLMLLLRKRIAVPIFLVSFIAMVITTFHNYVLSNGLEVLGGFALGFSAVIFVIALALYVYAWAMRKRGVLA